MDVEESLGRFYSQYQTKGLLKGILIQKFIISIRDLTIYSPNGTRILTNQ